MPRSAAAKGGAPARPRGRPSSFTPEVCERILALVRAGNWVDVACAAAGIHRSTLYDWKKRAEAGQKKFVEFQVELERAEAIAQVRMNTLVDKAAAKVWQAAAWRLERRWPHLYGRRDRLEHSGPDGKPIEQHATVTLEDIDEFLAVSRHNEQADDDEAVVSPVVRAAGP